MNDRVPASEAQRDNSNADALKILRERLIPASKELSALTITFGKLKRKPGVK